MTEIERLQAEIERLQDLHLERTKTTHKALCEHDQKIEAHEKRPGEPAADQQRNCAPFGQGETGNKP